MTRGQTPVGKKSAYRITLLPGDGIGVEVTAHARQLLETISSAIAVELAFEEIPCGGKFYLEHGSRDWPVGAEESCRNADAILLGAVGWPDPKGKGPVTMKDGKMAGYSAVLGNRMTLDLYANVRPVKMFPGTLHKISGQAKTVWDAKDVDMVFVRENTEGLYSGIGGVARRGDQAVASDLRLITERASERVIRFAFELSRKRNRKTKRVTCIVKNNVLFGCRLFAEVFERVGADYPDVQKELAIIDAFTQWLITQPEHYDVCVTTNMFGDIVTDLAAVLQGGMGMAVGANLGDRHAMFEPIHGSAPPLAGKNQANPMAMLLSAAEMLSWLGQRHDDARLEKGARAIHDAVAALILAGKPLTADLVQSGAASTSDVAAAVTAGARARLAS
jgi:3-isopropylmalate dehydrogenase